MGKDIQRLDSLATNPGPINGRPVSDIGTKTSLKTGTSFSEMCKSALGKSAGDQLSVLTGYPRSTCYRYADGQTVPPIDFLARLFASDVGQEFFLWLMWDCDAQWWTEMRHAADVGRKVLDITRNQ